jgi:hypothetical protein
MIQKRLFLSSSGRRVRLRHIRNGEELPPITADNNYDPGFQEYRRLQKPVQVHRVSDDCHFIWPGSMLTRHREVLFLTNTSKHEIFVYNIQYFCSYGTDNTLRLHYKDRPVNGMYVIWQ